MTGTNDHVALALAHWFDSGGPENGHLDPMSPTAPSMQDLSKRTSQTGPLLFTWVYQFCLAAFPASSFNSPLSCDQFIQLRFI